MKTVFIFGITGRMGQEIAGIVEKDPHLHLLGGYSQKNKNPPLEQSPDIVIDFSLPEALSDLQEFIKKHGSCLVSGTTGLTPDQKQQLQSLGQQVPTFWSANMSFGVFLMSRLTEVLAKHDKLYCYHVEETHHIHKKDKPSGTALIIEEAAKKSTNSLGPTKSIREGEIFGIHKFIAESANERLEITHEAFNRGLFAQGAVDIAQWLVSQPKGFYVMDDFFNHLITE